MTIKIGCKVKCLKNVYTTCKVGEIYEIENIFYRNGYTFFEITNNKDIYELITHKELCDFEVME